MYAKYIIQQHLFINKSYFCNNWYNHIIGAAPRDFIVCLNNVESRCAVTQNLLLAIAKRSETQYSTFPSRAKCHTHVPRPIISRVTHPAEPK